MRRLQVLKPGGIQAWEVVPDLNDVAAAYRQGVEVGRSGRFDVKAIHIAARELMATLTPDPPEVIANRRKELASW